MNITGEQAWKLSYSVSQVHQEMYCMLNTSVDAEGRASAADIHLLESFFTNKRLYKGMLDGFP